MMAMLSRRVGIATSIATIILASLVGSGCGDDQVASPSGFAGEYMMFSMSKQDGACGGQGTAMEVPGSEVWFKLDDVTLDTGPLVAYYHCESLGSCDSLYDLYKSFGAGTDGSWLTVVASSLQPPCTLGYRRRVLTQVDPMTIQIVDTLQQLVDDTLSGADCNKEVAKARKDEMPCVEETVWLATRTDQ